LATVVVLLPFAVGTSVAATGYMQDLNLLATRPPLLRLDRWYHLGSPAAFSLSIWALLAAGLQQQQARAFRGWHARPLTIQRLL
jgi:hypothetical protein